MTIGRQIGVAALICTSATLLLRSQNLVVPPPVFPPSVGHQYGVSVDVNLVNVTATVIDGAGRSLNDLTAADFRVLENDQEQKIAFFSYDAQVPISLGLLIDCSGSLQDKFRQALQAARSIAATMSSNDEMFVTTFNSRVEVKQRFTNNPEEIERALRNARPHGETAVYDAISTGLREMQTAQHKKRILLLLSDGFDTRSRTSAAQAEDLLRSSGVLLYAIGMDDDDNDPSTRRRTRYHIYEYMLNKLTGAAGGRVIRLYTGRNYDLRTFSDLLFGELHQGYTIGYYPAVSSANARSRNIEVRVEKAGARVLAESSQLQRRID